VPLLFSFFFLTRYASFFKSGFYFRDPTLPFSLVIPELAAIFRTFSLEFDDCFFFPGHRLLSDYSRLFVCRSAFRNIFKPHSVVWFPSSHRFPFLLQVLQLTSFFFLFVKHRMKCVISSRAAVPGFIISFSLTPFFSRWNSPVVFFPFSAAPPCQATRTVSPMSVGCFQSSLNIFGPSPLLAASWE